MNLYRIALYKGRNLLDPATKLWTSAYLVADDMKDVLEIVDRTLVFKDQWCEWKELGATSTYKYNDHENPLSIVVSRIKVGYMESFTSVVNARI